MDQKFEKEGKNQKPRFIGSEFWDVRYKNDEYAYGEAPNLFLKDQMGQMKPGKVLFVAEGEGRNAVYAAQLGWEVDAIDFSQEGKAKAERLAQRRSVAINYQIADATTFETEERYDLIVFVFFHIGEDVRKPAFKRYIEFLKPGGRILAELYSPNQLGRTSGGPPRLDFLVSVEELKEVFGELDILMLEEVEVELNEGPFHKGLAITSRLIAQKG